MSKSPMCWDYDPLTNSFAISTTMGVKLHQFTGSGEILCRNIVVDKVTFTDHTELVSASGSASIDGGIF